MVAGRSIWASRGIGNPGNFMKIILILIVLLFSLVAFGGDTGSAFTQKEADDLVAYHNKIRKDVGVPPVKWSTEIAKFAQEWADEIAKTGDIKHRPREGDFAQKYGECWSSGNKPNIQIMSGAKSWYDEIKFYKTGTPVTVDNVKEIGHFTQMAWKTTTLIGAGKAIIKTGPRKGWLVVVCNYDPAGNVSGEAPY